MKKQPLDLSDAEMAVVKRIAEHEGITEDEAATQLVQKEIARRVRKRTGRGPARVFQMRGK